MRIALFIAAGLCGLVAPPVQAQDRIVLQHSGSSRIPMSGYIEDYNGREIVFRIRASEPARRYPRTEIAEVTTEYTPHHEQARKLYAAGKIAESKRELTAALDDEDRPWVRREIIATQVKCALWNGDHGTAISRFLAIVESDPETFHFSVIPLCWAEEETPVSLRFDAREWIGPGTTPLLKLIGASWLLSVSDGSNEVEMVLKRLARESDVRIQRLAQMQLWRLKLKKSGQLEAGEITHWERFVEELPIELRGGAHYIIGQAWQQRREYDRAARAYLWLPLVYDTDRWLSSHACFEAAESLSSAGDLTQAANLYSEVLFRFGDTPWGVKAETAWKAILQKDSPAPAKSKSD